MKKTVYVCDLTGAEFQNEISITRKVGRSFDGVETSNDLETKDVSPSVIRGRLTNLLTNGFPDATITLGELWEWLTKK